MARRKGRRIIIVCDFPENAEDGDIADYTNDALTSWGGCFDPDNPLFQGIKIKSILIGSTKYTAEEPL